VSGGQSNPWQACALDEPLRDFFEKLMGFAGFCGANITCEENEAESERWHGSWNASNGRRRRVERFVSNKIINPCVTGFK
jgi:hypothetical protein